MNATRTRPVCLSPTSLPLPESEESGEEDSGNISEPANAAVAAAPTYRTTPLAMSILDETEQNQVWIGSTGCPKINFTFLKFCSFKSKPLIATPKS